MKIDKDWKRKPQEGCEFIYRYYDKDNKSYIGHTKQSLFLRAGGIKGRNYTRITSKFQEAIIEKGFDEFEYEILEEVSIEEAEKREKYFIKKFDSKINGYNSTYGGKAYFEGMKKKAFVIDLNNYTEDQIYNLTNNVNVFLQNEEKETNIDKILKRAEMLLGGCFYTYYTERTIWCHPVALIFNFLDVMVEYRFNCIDEINDAMLYNEICGGDIFTFGEYNTIDVKLLNGEIVSF